MLPERASQPVAKRRGEKGCLHGESSKVPSTILTATTGTINQYSRTVDVTVFD